MDLQLAGKRVLVTGSTRGIGRAAAALFLAEGAGVILHGRSPEAVTKSARELSCEGIAARLDDRQEVLRLVREAGEVDVLVNCAGVYEEKSIADTDEVAWDRMFATNLTAPFLLCRALLPGLARRRGVIVNVSSDSGLLGYPNGVAYCASKGALIGLTRALAVECAPAVRALCVCPGPVDTDMMRETVAAQPDPHAAMRQWESVPLLRRVARPDEIGRAILAAASPVFSYATGGLIVVDGGASAGRKV